MAHAAISRPAPRSALCLANPQELSRNLLLGPPDCRSATAFESRRIPPVDSALLVRKNSNRRNLGGGIRFGADGCRLGRKIARTAELNSHRGVVCLGSASGREGEFGGYFVNELPLPGAYEGLIRRRALKMATMAVPRALMEDTTGDDHGAGDLEVRTPPASARFLFSCIMHVVLKPPTSSCVKAKKSKVASENLRCWIACAFCPAPPCKCDTGLGIHAQGLARQCGCTVCVVI